MIHQLFLDEVRRGRNIVMFQRRLSRKIAGGARAVFDRGTLFETMGYAVTYVIMDKSPERSRAAAELRRAGILHPASNVVFAQDLLETSADRLAALSAPPLHPEIPISTVIRERHKDKRRITRDYYVGDTVRATIRYFSDGAIRSCELSDEVGYRRQVWKYDTNGTLLQIDDLNPEGVAIRSRLVANGRFVFLDIDLTIRLGLGMAEVQVNGRRDTYARLLAEAIQAHFPQMEKPIVIADGENMPQNVLRAFSPGRVFGVSVLHNNHTLEPFTADAPIKPDWEPFFDNLNNIDAMVCLTERQRLDLLARFPSLPLVKIYHPAFPPPAISKQRNPNALVFVGRLSYQKRIDHLIAVFARVHRHRPQTVLDIWGDGDLAGELRKMVAEAGLSDSVRLHGFTEEPLVAFAGAALTVMTSYFEGLPLTLFEAMSVGTPFVAYNLNYGPEDVITSGDNGVLVANGDIKAAADEILSLLDDPVRLTTMSDRARSVVDQFALDRIADDWRRLFDATTVDSPCAKGPEKAHHDTTIIEPTFRRRSRNNCIAGSPV